MNAKHALLAVALALASNSAAHDSQAKDFRTLYRFTGRADGALPTGDLALQNGALYGTTYGGSGVEGKCPLQACGTVFRLDLTTGTLTTLHNFSGGADGGNPRYGVIVDAAGMIYGTTEQGGNTSNHCPLGCGTVFELDPVTQTLTTLHPFSGVTDGFPDYAGLVLNNGKLYGTTEGGGAHGGGTVFRLDPVTRKLTTIYAFCALPQCADGVQPLGRLTFDSAGTLYGTTLGGGTAGYGSIFELNPATGALATLHSFERAFNGSLEAALVLKNDKLFGTLPGGEFTQEGGRRLGTIFRFGLATERFRTLHFFGGGEDGAVPIGGLTADPSPHSGWLYGTTDGYPFNPVNYGTVFRFDSGHRTLTTLHLFSGLDGEYPEGSLALDASGTLYGSTANGGDRRGICGFEDGCGTIFQLVP